MKFQRAGLIGFAVLALLPAFQQTGLGPQAADPPKPVTPVRPEDRKDNVEVRLVGSETSVGRDQRVSYKFETLGEDRKVVWFGFRPGAATTTHTLTLARVIQGCLERDREGDKTGPIRYKVKDGVEAIFSFPKNGTGGGGYFTDEEYERCYLVSLKIGEKK